MVDKNYFLSQLRNGVDVNAMGQAMADMMNEAIADYNAEQEAVRKAQAEKEAREAAAAKKQDAAMAIVDAMKVYCDLTNPGAMDDLEIDDDDIKTLIDALDQTFALMGAVKELKSALEGIEDKPATKANAPKKAKSDDEALAAFLATIM